ncbi:MAG: PGF-pre-PGF domain-containing protein [Candidatus Thermoplasmatota archaeon]|nr:PGF-pre-PGF domain-containing protein [Candidatus Thermoplasmatota archaeon]
MRLGKSLVDNKIVWKLFIFSIVFILFFSCFAFFYVDTIRAEPTIRIENPGLDSVIYDKTPTIKISYYDVGIINPDSIVFYLDNIDLTSSANVTSEGLVYIPSSELALGRHTILLTVSDTLNNSAVKSDSFNIASSISSVEEDIGDINPDDDKEISIDWGTASQMVFYSVVIDSVNKLEDTNLFIANLSISSADITRPTMADTTLISFGAGYSITYTQNLFIYSYSDIEFLSNGSSINETNIDSITLKFKIAKSWMDSNDVDKNGVRLLRYKNDGWQELTTNFDSEDTNFVYYSAMTKGFSLFALVGPEKLVEKTSAGGGINVLLIVGVIIAVIIIIILLLFKLGYLYIEK